MGVEQINWAWLKKQQKKHPDWSKSKLKKEYIKKFTPPAKTRTCLQNRKNDLYQRLKRAVR